MSAAAYSCIERYFVHLNIHESLIARFPIHGDISDHLDYRVFARELQLYGGDVMWRIVLEADRFDVAYVHTYTYKNLGISLASTH
jgi:hypothetical protein